MMLSKTSLCSHQSQESLMFHLSGKQNKDVEKKEKKRKDKVSGFKNSQKIYSVEADHVFQGPR